MTRRVRLMQKGRRLKRTIAEAIRMEEKFRDSPELYPNLPANPRAYIIAALVSAAEAKSEGYHATK